MRALFLDVASHDGLIACVGARAIVASQTVGHRITDRELVAAISEVLRDAGWQYGDLTNIACVVGPGGFTSLRVGVSAANALAWALKIPSCGIHLSDLYAVRAHRSQLTARSFIWFHSTKKHEVFLRGFGAHAHIAPQAQWMKLEDALAVIPVNAVIVGELIPEHRDAVERAGVRFADLRPLVDVLPDFLRRQRYQEQTLLPWYGRGM